MTEWNEQAAPNNNLKTSDMKPKRAVGGKSKAGTNGDEPLKNEQIQEEILKQNL
ncbi:hypothetical protein ACIQZM_04645 [Peribacillus sp. NPDC097206]|uniref:hypothetical protein n=1 Tax=unclassified Peribacillus TaxID=2675266 RepID=UPI00380DE02A